MWILLNAPPDTGCLEVVLLDTDKNKQSMNTQLDTIQ